MNEYEYEYETPSELAARLRLGREEFGQRLLTSLILHGPYPKWNTRCSPSPAGLAFLHGVFGLSFPAQDWIGDELEFVDEFELLPRTDAERGGSPDYCVISPTAMWMIELKTERASHRRDQIHSYFELAHYHHPHLELALTYLTPPMEYVYAPESGIYGQVTWADVKPLIRSAWSQPSNASEVAVVDGLCDLIDNLHQPPSEWLTELRDTDSVPTLHHEAVGEAMSLAASTASDGSQRAIGYRADGLNELIDLRIEMRDAIAASAEDSPLRHVRPWVWTENSGGSALTAEGGELGAELRLSRYQHPI